MRRTTRESLQAATQMVTVAIDELQAVVDRQLALEHFHRWRDGSIKLSRLRRIRKELQAELDQT